jgi:hypothetical protein
MHISIKKYLISSVVVEKLLWPQNRVIFVDFDPDRLYVSILYNGQREFMQGSETWFQIDSGTVKTRPKEAARDGNEVDEMYGRWVTGSASSCVIGSD